MKIAPGDAQRLFDTFGKAHEACVDMAAQLALSIMDKNNGNMVTLKGGPLGKVGHCISHLQLANGPSERIVVAVGKGDEEVSFLHELYPRQLKLLSIELMKMNNKLYS